VEDIIRNAKNLIVLLLKMLYHAALAGCCFTWYMEEVVEPGIAEDMMMGPFRGYEDTIYVERNMGVRAK